MFEPGFRAFGVLEIEKNLQSTSLSLAFRQDSEPHKAYDPPRLWARQDFDPRQDSNIWKAGSRPKLNRL